MSDLTPDELRALGRMWPNRQHESNWLKALLCLCGVHRWHTMTFEVESRRASFDFCRWCPVVKRH